MSQANARNVAIDFSDQGAGDPALLLMPGWCSSKAMFEPVLSYLAGGRRTLALDWRGHGRSGKPPQDFGQEDLVQDALAVIEAAGAAQVVPVAVSHAGWVAIELARRLGTRVPALVLLDWIVLPAPPPFLEVLARLRSETNWRGAVTDIFGMWRNGVDQPALRRFIEDDMGSYGYDMWSRAAREIAGAYADAVSPLDALTALGRALPVLHLYAQPDDPNYLAAQQAFAREHPWFEVRKLDARSHFPMFETPAELAHAIGRFVARAAASAAPTTGTQRSRPM